jgi:hypothetical protein
MNNQGLRSSGRGTKMFAMHPAIGRRPQAIAEEFGLVPRADRRDPKFAIRDPVMTALDRLRCGYSRHDPPGQPQRMPATMLNALACAIHDNIYERNGGHHANERINLRQGVLGCSCGCRNRPNDDLQKGRGRGWSAVRMNEA